VGRRSTPRTTHRDQGLWAALALPGTAWLLVLFVVPFYAVIAVAFGRPRPGERAARPIWNPLRWQATAFTSVLHRVFGGALGQVFVRTFSYVVITIVLCFLIGYPVAYYAARKAKRSRGLVLLLLVLPFWISYLMRMLAWVNLLQRDGYVNRFLQWIHLLGSPRNWLTGDPITVVLGLVYGYIPFFILPLYAALERIDGRYLEAARDLGAGPGAAFWKVTWPLSRQGCLAAGVITVLPMFGDYYTNGYLSGSPKTEMIGNQITFYLQGSSQPQTGASLVLVLSALLVVLMGYYLVSTSRAARSMVAK